MQDLNGLLEKRERLRKQMEFIVEVDKVKGIFRQSYLTDGSRHENDAEHSWHLALMALLLAEYANGKVDVLEVLRMLLVHDLVEIDAGDTYIYDDQANEDKHLREKAAADRIFGLLPEDQEKEFRTLWETFEAKETPEAKFAAALDRIQPMLLNYITDGVAWKEHGVSKSQVLGKNLHTREGSEGLWALMEDLLEDAVEKGFLRDA
ncbi:HD domain-containing protein [Anaerotalea alkaliphila]|uniref:5'-deoxynucleotidase n=1 Tax=Anaerotalea alkaliphila TaxID=2662126 RepID=A0A7X5HWK2_9FIRM|nr:HD domain-containing protein [Anaerotalea alkaliphila]NDL67978.1 HD domain-containing protein [Anaerotalea alkaliphila]